MSIIYKPIPGYVGIYEAGSDGSIWTCEGKTTYRKLANGKMQARVWNRRQLKPKKQLRNSKKNLKVKHYDLRVNLWNADGVESTKLVARLVASAFHPNPYNYPCVNHIDGDTENNSPDNLEWCTYKYNNRHALVNEINNWHKPVTLTKDNTNYNFISLSDASKWLGYNKGYLSDRINSNNPCIDGYTIREYHGKDFHCVTTKIHHNKKHNKGVALVESNGTIHFFNSRSQASEWLGKCSTFISSRIAHNNLHIGKYTIRPY